MTVCVCLSVLWCVSVAAAARVSAVTVCHQSEFAGVSVTFTPLRVVVPLCGCVCDR